MSRILSLIAAFVLINGLASGQSFQGNLKVQVTDLLSNQPIPRAQVEVHRRMVDYTDDGLPSLRPFNESRLYIQLGTDENGVAAYPIPLDHPTGYFVLVTRAEGMEPMYHNLVALRDGEETLIEVALTPLHPTPAQQQTIEDVLEDDWYQKEIDKIADSQNHQLSDPPKQITKSPNHRITNPCTYDDVPAMVYVQNLINGYNSAPNGPGFTGLINFDEYVAGVVNGEIGGITSNMNTKKAQAIAARTFSQNRHELDLPVNLGQAYRNNIPASTMQAAMETSGEVILFNNEVIDAKYAARCNGDYTQHSTMGTWSPYTTCNTYGNFIPYLRSRPCSGHLDCSHFNESPCCNAMISTLDTFGYIFGHGVGMCQRGIEELGELYDLDYCTMLHRYYTNVCIANADCDSMMTTLDCANPLELVADSLYNRPASVATSRVEKYACNNWTETGPERVHTFTPPAYGRITATISNFDGDLDVYILGSCDPMDCLGTVFSSEAVFDAALPGETYYIVVDADDGSGSAYDIIVTFDAVVSTEGLSFEDEVIVFPNPADEFVTIKTGKFSLKTVRLYNALGRLAGTWQGVNRFGVSHLPGGIYWLALQETGGQQILRKLVVQR